MAGQSGMLFALGVRTTSGANPVYTYFAGIRTRTFKINNNPVDVTTAPVAYLTGTGTVSASTVTLPTSFSDGTTTSSSNSFYNGENIIIAGVAYPITGYVGSTRVATVTGTPPTGSQSITVTNPASSRNWKEMIGDVGQVELEITASGLYQKTAMDHLLPTLSESGAKQAFQLLSSAASPGMSIVGAFVVSEYTASAPHDGAVTFSVKLTSAGTPTITYSPAATTVA